MSNTTQDLLTQCDAYLGAMDKHLGAATERQGVLMVNLSGQPDLLKTAREAQLQISSAHALLGKASAALAEVAAAVIPPVTTPPGGDRFVYPEPTQVIAASIGWGEAVRGYQADMTKVTAMSFVAQKNGSVSLGVAEYGSPPTTYQSSFSPDFAGMSQGNQTYSTVQVVAGQSYTFYFRAWSSDIGPTATYPVQGVAVEGAWPQ